MPLFRKKPFPLLEPSDVSDPHELFFQVRFTKEIFKDYQEYLNRINLYRQRIWTCKVTGKTNLTYEEALVSEQHATEKLQQFPKELMAFVLQMIQFSTLGLKDLVNSICMKMQGHFSEGLELHGRKDNSVCPCKILKVLKDVDQIRYEVGWLDEDKKVTGSAAINADDLIRKKLPFSRHILKSFIRDSTSQSAPWVVHEELARKHGVSTEPPEELRVKVSIQDGCVGSNEMKRKNNKGKRNVLDAKEGEIDKNKRKKLEAENYEGLSKIKKAKKVTEKPKEEPIKYPIDDLLVQPDGDDPVLTDRPSPSSDFKVPMDCVGDLLMVWDFCSSFSKLLHLWPFSLEDFENAICHKGNNLILIVEAHSAILSLLIKEEGEYFTTMQKKKRKSKIMLMNWTEYLCGFIEMRPELSTYIATIKRGRYGLLDTYTKLSIFRELVAEALATDAVREQLDKYIEHQRALDATKREAALREARKRREEKELLKAKSDPKKLIQGHNLENGQGNVHISENVCNKVQNGDAPERGKWFICNHFLGKDRNYNRYWFFSRDGRIFVESSDSQMWGYYSAKEELDALMGSLNRKGEREMALQGQLEKYNRKICSALQKKSKDIAHKMAMKDAILRRSMRVRAQPKDDPTVAFLRYVNKWKED